MANVTNNVSTQTIQINTDLNLFQVEGCSGLRMLSTEGFPLKIITNIQKTFLSLLYSCGIPSPY